MRLLVILLTILGLSPSTYAATPEEQMVVWIAAKNISQLEKVVNRTPETRGIWMKLGLYHDAVYALNRIKISKSENAEIKAAAKKILDDAMEKSFDNYLAGIYPDQHKEKPAKAGELAHEILLFRTADLGDKWFMNHCNFENLVSHEDAQVRIASAIWLAEHFISISPHEGWFPSSADKIMAVVPESERSELLSFKHGWFWSSHYTLGFMRSSPLGKTLARLSYNAEFDPSEESRAASSYAWSIILPELKKADVSVNEPELIGQFSHRIDTIRSNLSERLLKEVRRIRETWEKMKTEINTGGNRLTELMPELEALRDAGRDLVGTPPLPFCEAQMSALDEIVKASGKKE